MRFGKKISRREMLKVFSLIPLAGVADRVRRRILDPGERLPNVLIIVFDAWSARHLTMYGYPRATMPNLEKFAQKATVFHKHYSAATFTVPGTASLLSGLHPWSHRAIALSSGGVLDRHTHHNILSAFTDSHSTLGYAQNVYADLFLYQFVHDLDVHVQSGAFDLKHRYINDTLLFQNDARVSFASFHDNIFQENRGFDASLLLGTAFRLLKIRERSLMNLSYKDEYPRGLPYSSEQFLLRDVVDGVLGLLKNIDHSTFGYLHLFPPHGGYAFSKKFKHHFRDGWSPPEKPLHELAGGKSVDSLNLANEYYDEYLANWDDELGALFDFLRDSGLLDNSYLVFTSDHGEIFERGEAGHFTPLIYDALIHVPLIISRPGQTERQDVYSVTSSVDVLPTLAHVAGKPVPDWAEGKLLPLFGGTEEMDRSIFSMDAKSNSAFRPLNVFTVSMTKGNFRLTYYKYPSFTRFEFYNLEDDPEELHNLYPSQPAICLKMRDELLQKLSEVNKPFEK